MLTKLTLAATLLAIIAVTTSATFAAPRPTVPPTGAQSFQDQGNSEEMGIPYHR
jgi:hypothetical protein